MVLDKENANRVLDEEMGWNRVSEMWSKGRTRINTEMLDVVLPELRSALEVRLETLGRQKGNAGLVERLATRFLVF